MKSRLALVTLAGLLMQARFSAAPFATRGPVDGRPDAIVNLNTAEGLAAVDGRWSARNVALVPTTFHRVADDLTPTGALSSTFAVGPMPGTAAFDAASFDAIEPGGLFARRGPGRVSFAWYRLKVTVPAMVGSVATAGASVVFEIVVDDYAEVWVNGRLSRGLGLSGASVISGFNAPNRVVLTRNARPGETFDVAVFAANGPLSDPPANYIWVRSATLDVYRPRPDARRVAIGVDRRDPALDAVVPREPVFEQLAGGFQFVEGPVWVSGEQSLLFSDPNDNVIYRWNDDTGVSVYRVKSGYSGPDIGVYHQPGSNGLALDAEGRLTIDEHGNRRVSRLERNGVLTVLADRYDGKRLNSPNDLVYKSDGALYFTDPPFGLPKAFDDPGKELPYSGVFRLANGRLQLLTTELTGPNGIAFSPDERYLYVTNWDEKKKVVMRYPVRADGTLDGGQVFFDMTKAPGEEALDGVKVDVLGNLFVSGPGGLWVIGPDGRHLGTLELPELAANMAWGGPDGKSLFLTARTGLYRLRVMTGRDMTSGSATTAR